MCGIVGYIGKEPVKVSKIMSNAVFNSFRGDDGVGIVYNKDDKFRVEKSLHKLTEIYSAVLNKKQIEKRERIGSIEITVHDEEMYNKKQEAFKSKMNDMLNTKTNMVIIHHRKATYGGKDIKNLHPIFYKNKYYIHNGTANIDSVKAWIQLHTKIEFTSETDTEVLAMLYNRLKEMFEGDKDKIYKQMEKMFPAGWGVLIEIDKKYNTTLIKDFARNLWLYKVKNGIVFVSEPTPYVNKFDKLYMLDCGIMELNNDTEGEDYTDVNKQINKWWTTSLKVGDEVEYDSECEICKTKKSILSTAHCDGHKFGSVRKDMCYECMIFGTHSSEYIDNEDEQLEVIKNVYANYIG